MEFIVVPSYVATHSKQSWLSVIAKFSCMSKEPAHIASDRVESRQELMNLSTGSKDVQRKEQLVTAMALWINQASTVIPPRDVYMVLYNASAERLVDLSLYSLASVKKHTLSENHIGAVECMLAIAKSLNYSEEDFVTDLMFKEW